MISLWILPPQLFILCNVKKAKISDSLSKSIFFKLRANQEFSYFYKEMDQKTVVIVYIKKCFRSGFTLEPNVVGLKPFFSLFLKCELHKREEICQHHLLMVPYILADCFLFKTKQFKIWHHTSLAVQTVLF